MKTNKEKLQLQDLIYLMRRNNEDSFINLENETTLKLSQDMNPNALCARVNGRLRELNYRLKGRHEIIF